MISAEERVANYVRTTGWADTMWRPASDEILGYWVLGQNYRVKSQYHGGYPETYLKRIKALYPEPRRVLHLFSGKADTKVFPGDTVDLNEELDPTYWDDAETLEGVPLRDYDLVLADPPYTGEDADHYGTPMVNRTTVMRTLAARLPAGAHVVWLDMASVMYRKDEWSILARIGMERSTNHRFRTAKIFVRKGPLVAPFAEPSDIAKSICLARVAADPNGCGGGAIGYHAIGEPGGCPECQAEAKTIFAGVEDI